MKIVTEHIIIVRCKTHWIYFIDQFGSTGNMGCFKDFIY